MSDDINPVDINPLIASLVATLGRNVSIIGKNTAGIAQEDSLLSELLTGLDRSQELLQAALAGATPAQLAEPSGMRDNSKLEWLEFLTWHDTYHTGQTAVYRRLAGLAGTL